MSWLAIKLFFMKSWAIFKKYWQIFFGVLISILFYIFTRDSSKMGIVLEDAHSSHKKQMAKIDEIKSKEREKIDAAINLHDENIKKIELEYSEKVDKISEDKEKRKEELRESGDSTVTDLISDALDISNLDGEK